MRGYPKAIVSYFRLVDESDNPGLFNSSRAIHNETAWPRTNYYDYGNRNNLTPEQQEKARACKTPEEVLALAKEEGFELSDEQLEAVSGGWDECDTYTGNKHDRFCRSFR